jgi:prefoldin alpha subunit
MPKTSTEDVNRVINENLKRDLENLEQALNKTNEEIVEYMQLKKTLEFMVENKSKSGFKTKVDVGANMFMKAKVDKIEPILVNVGLDVFLELKIDEALKFLNMKIKILEKEADVIRDGSLKTRAHIKILLMYLAEHESSAAILQ